MSGRHAAPKRRRREYEDDDFAKACGRMLRALERRASVNPDALAYLMTIRAEADDAVRRAGHVLHVERGFSLTKLAEFMTQNGHRMSRQAAQQRWGRTPVMAREVNRVLNEVNATTSWADWQTAERGEQLDAASV